jgi:hypothetical protein
MNFIHMYLYGTECKFCLFCFKNYIFLHCFLKVYCLNGYRYTKSIFFIPFQEYIFYHYNCCD